MSIQFAFVGHECRSGCEHSFRLMQCEPLLWKPELHTQSVLFPMEQTEQLLLEVKHSTTSSHPNCTNSVGKTHREKHIPLFFLKMMWSANIWSKHKEASSTHLGHSDSENVFQSRQDGHHPAPRTRLQENLTFDRNTFNLLPWNPLSLGFINHLVLDRS